jgi:hypothetical protein
MSFTSSRVFFQHRAVNQAFCSIDGRYEIHVSAVLGNWLA